MKLLAVLCACVVALGSSPVSHTRNDSTRHPLAKIVGRDGGALDDSFGGSTPEYSNVSWHSSSLSEEAGRGAGSPHDASSSSSWNWSDGSLIAKIVGSDGGGLDDFSTAGGGGPPYDDPRDFRPHPWPSLGGAIPLSERAAEAAVVQLALHLDVNPEATLAALAKAVDVLVLGTGNFLSAVHNSILALFRGQEDCGRADATAFAIGAAASKTAPPPPSQTAQAAASGCNHTARVPLTRAMVADSVGLLPSEAAAYAERHVATAGDDTMPRSLAEYLFSLLPPGALRKAWHARVFDITMEPKRGALQLGRSSGLRGGGEGGTSAFGRAVVAAEAPAAEEVRHGKHVVRRQRAPRL